MILVTGGTASGKLAYVLSLGYCASDVADGTIDARPVVHHAERLLSERDDRSFDQLVEALFGKEVVTCSDLGAGLVPATAQERRLREEAGRLGAELAKQAECVVRMTCGIPCAIKGELPSAGLAAQQHEYPFFTNRTCEYFPCHDDLDPAEFNCLFCYCPLYALGPRCGGRFTYTEAGVKNCAGCSIPHNGDAGTRLVLAKWNEIKQLAGR